MQSQRTTTAVRLRLHAFGRERCVAALLVAACGQAVIGQSVLGQSVTVEAVPSATGSSEQQPGRPDAEAGTAIGTSQPSETPAPGTGLAEAPATGDGDRPSIDGAGDDSAFRLTLTPYAWLTSYSGDISARGLTFDVDLSFSDILDGSDSVIGLMGAVDVEYHRFVFQFNGAYAKADAETQRGRTLPTASAVVSVESDMTFETTWLEAFAGYRFVDSPFGKEQENRVMLDAFAGVRYTSIELDLGVTAEATVTLPRGRELTAGVRQDLDASESWVEPFVGLRAGAMLGDNWRVFVRGDVGGFDVDDSEFAWQVIAAVGYQWRFDGWSLSLLGGYRALGQDYSDGDFEWDMITHGPIIGFSAGFVF